jgi:hypothetical protein
MSLWATRCSYASRNSLNKKEAKKKGRKKKKRRETDLEITHSCNKILWREKT